MTSTVPDTKDDIDRQLPALQSLCRDLGVRRLELFGSAARGESPRDLDFLVDLGDKEPGEYASTYFELLERLTELFAQPIDLITPANLGNPYFRERVESEKRLLYAS